MTTFSSGMVLDMSHDLIMKGTPPSSDTWDAGKQSGSHLNIAVNITGWDNHTSGNDGQSESDAALSDNDHWAAEIVDQQTAIITLLAIQEIISNV